MTFALQVDFCKPLPALIIQAVRVDQTVTVTILPITSDLVDAPLRRLTVEPSETNGLRRRSQIMIDKVSTTQRDKISPAFGAAGDTLMLEASRALALFLGLVA